MVAIGIGRERVSTTRKPVMEIDPGTAKRAKAGSSLAGLTLATPLLVVAAAVAIGSWESECSPCSVARSACTSTLS